MRYIQRKDNGQVKAFGYVEPGGLGEFDPDVYEEVEGALPKDYVIEPPPLPLKQQITEVFLDAISKTNSGKSAELQKEVLKLGDALDRALTYGLHEAAAAIIDEAVTILPEELKPYADLIKSKIPKGADQRDSLK